MPRLEKIHVSAVQGHGIKDICKYTKNQHSIYIKHLYVPNLTNSFNPTLSTEEHSLMQALDCESANCYVLIYVRAQYPVQQDSAALLRYAQLHDGLNSQDINFDFKNLSFIAQAIRALLSKRPNATPT